MTGWYHLHCYMTMRTTTKPSNLPGYDDLTAEQQDDAQAAVDYKQPELEGVAHSQSLNNRSAHTRLALTVRVLSRADELSSKYVGLKVKELQEVLRANKQLVSGNKGELVARCVDGERNGALPGCPSCRAALEEVEENGQAKTLGRDPPILKKSIEGGYHCLGHYNEVYQTPARCKTQSFLEHEVREPASLVREHRVWSL